MDLYFNQFPLEIIHLINLNLDTYIFIHYLPFICDQPGKYILTKSFCYDDIDPIIITSSHVDINLDSQTISRRRCGSAYIIGNNISDLNIHHGILIGVGIKLNNANASICNLNISYVDTAITLNHNTSGYWNYREHWTLGCELGPTGSYYSNRYQSSNINTDMDDIDDIDDDYCEYNDLVFYMNDDYLRYYLYTCYDLYRKMGIG